MNSINQPWAISEKHRERYGNIWSEMDFKVNNKLTSHTFRNDPMNAEVGVLELAGQKMKLKYRTLLSYANTVAELSKAAYFEKGISKHDKFVVSLGTKEFYLQKHEIGKLAETLVESADCISKSYQLGLYL